MWIIFLLTLLTPFSWSHNLPHHNWKLSDIADQRLSLEEIQRTLKTNWDKEASDINLAHLYAYQFWKITRLQTAKIFLFSNSPLAKVATVVNDSHHLYAFDHHEKRFLHIEDWKQKYSKMYCEELVNPSDETILKIQIGNFYPQDKCFYMIVPGHVYQQLELYPTSTPKDFEESDVVQACYDATDRKIFRRDEKRCRNWARNP